MKTIRLRLTKAEGTAVLCIACDHFRSDFQFVGSEMGLHRRCVEFIRARRGSGESEIERQEVEPEPEPDPEPESPPERKLPAVEASSASKSNLLERLRKFSPPRDESSPVDPEEQES